METVSYARNRSAGAAAAFPLYYYSVVRCIVTDSLDAYSYIKLNAPRQECGGDTPPTLRWVDQ